MEKQDAKETSEVVANMLNKMNKLIISFYKWVVLVKVFRLLTKICKLCSELRESLNDSRCFRGRPLLVSYSRCVQILKTRELEQNKLTMPPIVVLLLLRNVKERRAAWISHH